MKRLFNEEEASTRRSTRATGAEERAADARGSDELFRVVGYVHGVS